MAAFLLFSFLLLIQPAFQTSESNSFLIYNENLKLCIQSLPSLSIILDYCDTANEWQRFKWVSDNQILNSRVVLCLTGHLESNNTLVTLMPCNKTNELQKWGCRRNGSLALQEHNLFLQPSGARKSNVIVHNAPNLKSTWKTYTSKENLCSKSYEELFTLEGNSFGAPCVFPFKYMDKWHADCITDDEEDGRLWCGTTSDVDMDSLTGYCPVKDSGHDELFWTRNHWTGDLYQINSHSALTWFQALRSCNQQNAKLLRITELNEQMYLTGLTSSVDTEYWIGLHSLSLESGWQWIGSHPFIYFNWAPGSPSQDPQKICGTMKSRNGKWENTVCDQKRGYICKKENSSLDASDIPSVGSKPTHCSHGWAGYAGHCYQLYREAKTWKGAQLFCRKEGGDLASMHNIEEHSFVISQLGYRPTDQLWIGLNDQKTPMYFEWSDGTQVTFTVWQQGEPSYTENSQKDCVVMSGEYGYWADDFCEMKYGHICRREPSPSTHDDAENADPNCQTGWKRHGVYCYFIGQAAVAFSEARRVCEANKGFLTSVEDRYEHAFLTSLVGLHHEPYFWIGLSDVAQPGTFNWTNGDPVLFTHWNSKMPGQNAGCVAMRTGAAAGLWDVLSCEEKARFLCKQWAEDVTPPPVIPPPSEPPCPEGWTVSKHTCFKAYDNGKKYMKTWFEAQEFCKTIGGNLASVHSDEEQTILTQEVSSDTYWIGLSMLDPEAGLTWSDGSPVDFDHITFWESLDSDSPCAGLYYRWWHPQKCEKLLPWICQIKRGEPVKPEPNNTFEYSYKIIEDGWIVWNGNEYYFSNVTLPADSAQRFCKKNHGDLTVIENESEQKFLWKYNFLYGTARHAFIGLTLSLDRTFHWMNGTLVTFEAWAPNEPNFANDDENCVVMYADTGLWNDLNCGYENYFICERHNSSIRSAIAPTSPAPLGYCNEGWLLFDNKCFQIFGFNEGERKNWSESRTACKKLGGNLASIPSKHVQAFLTEHLKSVPNDAWIGLNDINSEQTFLWTDGSGVSYTNWATGFPSNSYSWMKQEDCVAMTRKPERQARCWKVQACSLEKSYICQRSSDATLSQHETTIPASGYIIYGNSSYSFISPKMTWEEARKKCHSENSEVATILEPYSQSFLWLQVIKYGEPVWIGLNSNMTDRTYKWISKWRLAYVNWGPGEPKQNIACVYLDIDGYWKTGSCNETYSSICERYHGNNVPGDISQSPGRCPESTAHNLSYWIPFRAHCYSIYQGKMDWSSASMRCTQLGGTLISMEDSTEMNFLLERTDEFGPRNYWIGLYKNIDGEWKWEDNTAVDFVNWKSGEPEVTYNEFDLEYGNLVFHGKCISMDGHTGEWNRYYCHERNGFICKRRKIIEEPTKQPSGTNEQGKTSAAAHGTVVMVLILVMVSLIGAGIAIYIFYKKRRNQQPTSSSFDNSLYCDDVLIIRNDALESPVDNSENKEGV